jgi:uncharacterized membrane protein
MHPRNTRSPMTLTSLLLLLTAVVTALIAGLYYGWSCSVIPGVARLPDAGYLSAMQAMNRAILNPLFFATFMGAAVLLPVSTLLHRGEARFLWLLAATVVYLVGSFGLTMVCNVPLNNALDGLDLHTLTDEGMARHRAAFEGPWVRWHTIRTWATVLALVLVVVACITTSSDEAHA